MPSASVCVHRFGSLIRAYQMVGLTPDRDYRYLEVNRFLRQPHPEIVARTEADLLKPRTFLTEVFGPKVRFTAPHIRLAYADGWQEPIMGFRIATASSYLEPIRKTLTVRGASISDIEKRAPTSIIRGEAPLLDLLGFSRTLRELSRESAEAVLWLSHYQPLWSYSNETMACYQG